MDYYKPVEYSFLQRISGVILGNKEVVQDLKENGTLSDAAVAFGLSALGITLIFILSLYIKFTKLQSLDLTNFFAEYDFSTELQEIIVEASTPSNFITFLGGYIWLVIAIIVCLAAVWILSSLILHLFAVGLKGQASVTDILVFNAFLLPLSIIFGLVLLLPAAASSSTIGPLIIVALMLMIALITIYLRALIRGLTSLYNLPALAVFIIILLKIALRGQILL